MSTVDASARTQVCVKCNREKPLTTQYFYWEFRKHAKDGFRRDCIECILDRTRKRRWAAGGRPLADLLAERTAPERACTTCAVIKPATREHFRPYARKVTLRRECLACEASYRRGDEQRAKGRAYRNGAGKESAKAANRRYYYAHPDRRMARSAVLEAKRSGRLVPKPCRDCGASSVHAHHHNGYAKEHWLDVVWLCPPCHSRAHHGERECYPRRST